MGDQRRLQGLMRELSPPVIRDRSHFAGRV